MSDVVKGMARAYFETQFADGWSYAEMEEKVPGHNADTEHSMRAALLWLAANVTEEMARAAYVKTRETDHLNNMHQCISAAIHAAAGGEG